MTWKESESVKTWLTGLDKNSKHDYELKFSKFLDFVKMTPDEILASRIKDMTSYDPRIRSAWEQRILQWREELEKQYKGWTLHQHIKAVMSFFSRNRVKLMFRKGDIPTPRTKRAEWIPNNIQIRQLYNAADVRNKCILLFSYQCGLSPIDISQLNIENLPIYDSNCQIPINDTVYFELYREKSNILTQAVMSSELLHDLDVYLRSRDYPKQGPLFLSHKGKRLGPIDMSLTLKDVAKLALGELGKKFKISLLRKSFQDALDNTPQVSRAFTESMMGHGKGITGSYSQPSPSEIKAAYDLVHPKVSINGYVQARTDLKDMSQKIDRQEEQGNLVMKTLARMVVKEMKQEGLLSTMTPQQILENYVAYGYIIEPVKQKKKKVKEE